MNRRCNQTSARDRGGFSLLEVLVACGILVIALASIAAVLPAAGSRLAEAAAQDRASAAATAAMAELIARNVVTRRTFPSGTGSVVLASTTVTGTFTPAAFVFGETLSLAATGSAMSPRYVTTTTSGSLTVVSGTLSLPSLPSGSTPSAIVSFLRTGTALPPALVLATSTDTINSLINSDTTSALRRGFFVEDDLQYPPSSISDLPANLFVSGVRQFNRGVCWGAMITPTGPSWNTTTAAKVSVAVFRKPGAATALTLTSATSGSAASTGIFVTNTASTPRSLQQTLLKPCSMVLAIPPQTTGTTIAPQWLPIRSSWTLTGSMQIQNGGTFIGVSGGSGALISSGSARTCVMFANPVPSQLYSSGTPALLNVIGFENLLLVDEKVVPLPP